MSQPSVGPVWSPSDRPAPLAGRRVRLRPVGPDDYSYLFGLSLDERISFRWRPRGTTPSYEAFVAGLFQGILAQFVIEGPNGQRLGLISAYNADLKNGVTYLAIVMDPEAPKDSAWAAFVLFMNYLIVSWDFRKVYAETSALSIGTFAGGSEKYYDIEGVLREHERYGGRLWDGYLLAFWCEQWRIHLERLLPLVTGSGKDGSSARY